MRFLKSYAVVVLLVLTCMFLSSQAFAQEKIGVLFIQHGGFEQYSEQNLFDASAHIFAVRPDHPVHYWFLYNSARWDTILTSGNGPKEIGKYSFEYERIGGIDPFPAIIDTQLALLAQDLQQRSTTGAEFVIDYTGWITGSDTIEQFPYPRFLYTAPDYIVPFPGFGLTEETISGITYCGEGEAGGPWPGCDPDRYDVDGPAERFIAAGVDRIIAIDLTTSGVRFFKTYDAINMLKMALADNGASIPIQWINDPNALMENSLPTAPVGNWGVWTPALGAPAATFVDSSVPLAGNPNPIAEDTTLAALLTEGAEAAFNSAVPDNATAVLIMNHATDDYAQYFDPKIDDTVVLNKNIKNLLLARHPDMDPDNIIGAFMGVKEDGTLEGYAGNERTRNMRGENLGKAWLYETTSVPGTFDKVGLLPGDEWGYRYWDALELLKDRGVEHIVICFPQIVADSVLNMVEIPNQIAKEIGFKNWLEWGTFDMDTYPGVGHPFADYWGIWVDTECADVDNSSLIVDCCFEMGGCPDNRPYPPLRQTTGSRDDLDPSLAYDVSEYGHLGYDPLSGAPDPNSPVQDQYTGTWAMYQPPNEDIWLVKMLSNHILMEAGSPTINGTISGAVQFGVTVNLYTVSCGFTTLVDKAITNSEGYYSFINAGAAVYRIVPEHDLYNFAPDSSQEWADLNLNEPYNFVATAK